jgi:D-alanyl-lipoteichoic acid acyltransferase DltB (MBOAT superfamily)
MPWSYALLFFALCLSGMWHGTTENYVWFGALNGLGVVVVRAYGDLLKAWLGSRGLQRYLESVRIRFVAVFVTIHYVCFCHLYFSSSRAWSILTGAAIAFTRSVTPDWKLVAGLALSILVGWALGSKANVAIIQQMLAGASARLNSNVGMAFSVVGKCLLVGALSFCLGALEQPAPPVLYMNF